MFYCLQVKNTKNIESNTHKIECNCAFLGMCDRRTWYILLPESGLLLSL